MEMVACLVMVMVALICVAALVVGNGESYKRGCGKSGCGSGGRSRLMVLTLLAMVLPLIICYSCGGGRWWWWWWCGGVVVVVVVVVVGGGAEEF